MAEYIDRQAAIDAIDGTDWYHQNKNKDMVHGANSAEDQAWYKEQDVYAAIKAIPAADVRPVVTCERCVYHVDCGYHYCNKWRVNCPDDADFFCAYGEEKS